MTHRNETPTVGAAGALEACLSQLNAPRDNSPTVIAQALFVPVTREIAELCFRVAAIKLIHAADNVAMGDDSAAWDAVDIAESRLAEGTAALRAAAPTGGAPFDDNIGFGAAP